MNEWTVVGLVVGFVVGGLFGAGLTFGYISYRAYTEYIKYQEELAEKINEYVPVNNSNGGMSA